MTKDEYAELLQEVGGGNPRFAEEAHSARRVSEATVTNNILQQYWGIILSCDAIYQFYVDTLREAGARLTSSTPQSLVLNLHWHLVSGQRFVAAYDLLARGYYSESAALCRTLWEITLAMAALGRNVVSIEELFGGIGNDTELTQQELNRRIRAADSKVIRTLIWENPHLASESKHAVSVFLNILNHSVHKSRLALARNFSLSQAGQPIPIFPRFSPKQTEMVGNVLNITTWCLVASVGYMKELLPEAGTAWEVRYRKALLASSEVCKRCPSQIVRGFEEVIDKIFIPNN